MRLAYGRLMTETNAFSPVETTWADFERFHLKEGAEVAEAARPFGNEVPGISPVAELSGFWAATARGVERVPLLSAWALPSGPMAADCATRFLDELTSRLERAMPLDGIYLALHGSIRAHGDHAEIEDELLRRVRAIAPKVPLALTYDMHAQMTAPKAELADVVVGYRTNPHRDLPQVGYAAGKLLRRVVAGARPTSAWRTLPLAIGGGPNVDFLSPLREIKAAMRRMERDPRVLRANLFTVHPFSDTRELGWSVHVTTADDPALARALADQLADMAWAARAHPRPRYRDPSEAIADARAHRFARATGAVFFSDVSDVVGAGAPGENTHLLRALLDEAQDLCCFVPLRDAACVAELWDQPIGTAVERAVGGQLDPAVNPPLPVRGTLAALGDLGPFGRAVRLDLGHVQLVVTDGIPYTLRPSFYTRLGLRMRDADVVVVKSFFHFMIGFAPFIRRALPVVTRGATDLDACGEVDHVDGLYPFADPADWRETDRRRRGA